MIAKERDVSREILQLVNWYEIPNSYPKLLKKTKNLKVILNELSCKTVSNTIDKYIIITFSIVSNPYPCCPYMFITKNYFSKFTIMSFALLL